MRVHLKGVHRVPGDSYRAKSEPIGMLGAAAPGLTGESGSPEFIRRIRKLMPHGKSPGRPRLHLIAEFKTSSEYLGLRPSTKRAYASYVKMVEAEFGDMPIEALSDPGCAASSRRGGIEWPIKPRKADYAWTTLARVLSVAKDRGRIPVNPCERGGRLYQADRTDRLWSESDLAQIARGCHARKWKSPVVLALGDGAAPRGSLSLRWSAYDGKQIRLRQSKTGRPW